MWAGAEDSDGQDISKGSKAMKAMRLLRIAKMMRLLRVSKVYRLIRQSLVELLDRLKIKIPDPLVKFIKLGAIDHSKDPKVKFGGKDFHKGQTLSAFTSAEAIASEATKRMREELKEKGTPMYTEEELTALAKDFNEGLAKAQSNGSKRAFVSWYTLFKEADIDGSGVVTFDEFKGVVRKKARRRTREEDEAARLPL